MNMMIAIDTDRRPAHRPVPAPTERPAAAGVERAVPTCECPEYCQLDHGN